VTLLEAIAEFGSISDRRRARDEEKARAKNGSSFRDEFGQWDPKNQRRSCGISTTPRGEGEHMRVFPSATGPSSMSGSMSSANSSPSFDLLRASPSVVRRNSLLVP